jgi:epoxyqueuosine reductase
MKKLSSDDVKRFALKKGADIVGIASIDRFKEYPEDKRPEHLLSGAKSVIVVGVRVLRNTVKPNLLLSALHHITLNMYHNQIAYDIGRFLDDRRYSAVVIPKLFGISTRHAAVETGLGILGKSRLLITPFFGPRQRVAAVITDAEPEPDRKITKKAAEKLCPTSCQACSECMIACPTGRLP